ncbi:MAG: phosphoribosylformylglycinamidine synthase, partial [Patescibacteria group bacterium]
MLFRFYRSPALSAMRSTALLQKAQAEVSADITAVETEWVYTVASTRTLKTQERLILEWILRETFQPERFGLQSSIVTNGHIEVGPRLAIVSPFSTNAVAICHACGLQTITRVERSRRFVFKRADGTSLSSAEEARLLPHLYDRMTEERYGQPPKSFDQEVRRQPLPLIPILAEGKAALIRASKEMGLGLGDQLVTYAVDHSLHTLQRDLSDVEVFKFGQLNSNHCRHLVFCAEYTIDGVIMPHPPMEMVRLSLAGNLGDIISALRDNAGAMAPHLVRAFVPSNPGQPSAYHLEEVEYCIILKVETHNHPTGVSPYAGAATGTGGEIRDRQANGRGGLPQTGLACYYVGNLFLPGYRQPWEMEIGQRSPSMAPALEILIQASNGASDYGNCFGQPLILGATRSFEFLLDEEWLGYVKPVMVAGGVGLMRSDHVQKQKPEPGFLVVQIGGDAYCIGLGGAGRSSVDSGSAADLHLDFASVQRANPEMEQRVDRVIRACVALGPRNPIVTIQDLGAGGDSVAVPEIVHPVGARIQLRAIPSGDPTMSVLELWCNESQERLVLILRPEDLELFIAICNRERCPFAVIGVCTGDGKIVVEDEDGTTPVNLGLDFLLSDLPQKQITSERVARAFQPLVLPDGLTVRAALEQVFGFVDVGSKAFLTRKVDRSVGGCVAQQQTVGALQLTLADLAVTADSFDSLTGTAQAIGEQPIKGILDSAAGARMSVAEALTNLMFAKVTGLDKVNFSATWQWPAGHPGEDARLYDAVHAVTLGLQKDLGVRIFVGKDSLSMATRAVREGVETVVKAPGTVQFVAVAPMADVTRKVTPALQYPGISQLLFLDLSGGQQRLGASTLARAYNQLGDMTPDLDDPDLLRRGFLAVQELLRLGLIHAGHDRSDGGLITTLLEMAFAGNCGLRVHFTHPKFGTNPFSLLFNEELGVVMEYQPSSWPMIEKVLASYGLLDQCQDIGRTLVAKEITVVGPDGIILAEDMRVLRDLWQATSYELDMRQTHSTLVESERESNFDRFGPTYALTFQPTHRMSSDTEQIPAPKVAILREAGTNGDQEMAKVFQLAGFTSYDVTMTDLADGRVSLADFRGLVLCGGFSNRDVPDAGKGWAATILFNEQVQAQFKAFFARPDTFSLGVCNGCQ